MIGKGVLKVCLCAFLLIFGISAGAQESPFTELLKKAGNSDDNGGADVVTVFDSTSVVVEESGLSHLTVHSLVKALTDDGAKSQSYKRFDYDPASNMIEVQKVIVHKADGSIVEIPLDRILDKPQPMSMIYWGARMKLIGIPRLECGDAVEVQYYTKGFMIAYLHEAADDSRYIPPMRGHYYDSIYFGSGNPIKSKVYVLKTLKTRPVQYSVYNGDVTTSSTFDDTHFTYIFKKQNIPSYPGEPRATDFQDYVPKVVLATVDDWYEKSKWFYAVNETTTVHLPDYNIHAKPFDYDQEIKDFTMKLIAPYKTDTDKRKAILHWVAQHIRYSGITIGKGEGYTLHPAIMTWRDRAGVCKDIAGMSLAMFRAAGYNAYPTMTMAGARVERIPADQFNHCVVAVDISGEGIKSDNLKGRAHFEDKWEMYDATWAPNSMDIWSRAEGDQNINIGAPEGEDLTAIRPYTPEENKLAVTSEAAIDKDGNLSGSITLTGLGYFDGRLRRVLVYTGNKQEINNRIANFVAGIAPGAELINYSHNDNMDFWTPLKLTINYRIPGYAVMYGEGAEFISPAGKFLPAVSYLFNIFSGTDLKERKTPMLIWSPQYVTIDENIAFPAGFKMNEFKNVDKGGEFSNLKLTASQEKKGIKVTGKYIVSDRYIEPEEYIQVKAVADGLREFADTQIYLRRQ